MLIGGESKNAVRPEDLICFVLFKLLIIKKTGVYAD